MVVLVDNKVSRAGWGVVLCGLLLALSAFPGLRVGAGGLQVHPINFAVLVLLVGSLPRLRVIPPHILLALLFFVGIFALVTLTQGSGLSLVLKVASSAATVLCVAAGTRTRGDFRAATIAILLSAVIISCRGLLFGDLESVAGINPMDGIANKNAFSLYVLPPLLLGGFMLVVEGVAGFHRVVVVACVLVSTLAIFSTGNRSGWLGVTVIATALGLKALGKARNALLIFAVIVTAVLLVDNFGNTRVIEERLAKTQEGYESDEYRLWIVRKSFEIGLEHPLVGVSPQHLPYYIGRRSVDGYSPATHNVFALVFGGGGVLLAFALLLLGAAMWFRPRWSGCGADGANAHYLLRWMVLLWCLRGFFSDEILYSQSFSYGIGLCLGLCITRGVWSS